MATPLGLAILSNNVDAVELLLEHGANPNKYVYGYNVYIRLCFRAHSEISNMLQQYGCIATSLECDERYRGQWEYYTNYVSKTYQRPSYQSIYRQ